MQVDVEQTDAQVSSRGDGAVILPVLEDLVGAFLSDEIFLDDLIQETFDRLGLGSDTVFF